jgi:capsular exopolysaccharide synthesis family protein
VDLHNYLQAVRQGWWLVLAIVVIAVGTGGAITLQTAPRYASDVTFFVNTPNQNATAVYQGSLFTQDRVKSYVDLVSSGRLAQTLAADPSLRLTAGQVSSRISAVNEPNTVLLTVTVTDTDRARGLKLCRALAVAFPALVQQIETPPGAQQPTVKVEVVDGPVLDSSPVSPQPLRNLALAALLGLVAGIGATVLRERLDTTVRDDLALRRAAGATVLGQIPYDEDGKSAPLIVGAAGHSARGEAMRKLRTNLRFVDLQDECRVIALTSAIQGEGKTTTCCNLAITMAESGSRVLLIDADLRRPRVAEYLGLESRIGLTDVLIGEVTITDAAQPWGDGDLFVMASGSVPPDPSELLGSQRMADLLGAARGWVDIVLIDTPPLLSVTDGAVVAVQADGTVLLSQYARTSQAQIGAAVQALQQVSARLLGCVLTMTRQSKSDAYQYDTYRSTSPAVNTTVGTPGGGKAPKRSFIAFGRKPAAERDRAFSGTPK